MANPITNHDLRELLKSLGFTCRPSSRSEKQVLFEHAGSGACLPLPANNDAEPAKAADLVSVRTHLHYRGHLDGGDFDRFWEESDRRAS